MLLSFPFLLFPFPLLLFQVWIAGKWLSRREQSFAPPGTHFHQFVVPPVTEYRSDCTYGKISQINLPKDTKNMHSCMVSWGIRRGGWV